MEEEEEMRRECEERERGFLRGFELVGDGGDQMEG